MAQYSNDKRQANTGDASLARNLESKAEQAKIEVRYPNVDNLASQLGVFSGRKSVSNSSKVALPQLNNATEKFESPKPTKTSPDGDGF